MLNGKCLVEYLSMHQYLRTVSRIHKATMG